MEEKRKYLRVPYRVDAVGVISNTQFPIRIMDISLNGLSAKTDQKLEPGALIDIIIDIANQDVFEPLKIKAVVVRVGKDRFSVQFKETEIDAFIFIRYVVELLGGDPELVANQIADQIEANTKPF